MVPRSGSSSQLMQRSRVDLPDPEEPCTLTTSPLFTVSEMSRSTSLPSKLLEGLLICTAATSDMFETSFCAKPAGPLEGQFQADADGPVQGNDHHERFGGDEVGGLHRV